MSSATGDSVGLSRRQLAVRRHAERTRLGKPAYGSSGYVINRLSDERAAIVAFAASSVKARVAEAQAAYLRGFLGQQTTR